MLFLAESRLLLDHKQRQSVDRVQSPDDEVRSPLNISPADAVVQLALPAFLLLLERSVQSPLMLVLACTLFLLDQVVLAD